MKTEFIEYPRKYATQYKDLSNKYLVVDVETNGFNSDKDDLLSLSIYDPSDATVYNRYFPLDLQESVKTTNINGITADDLSDEKHMTQDEFNNLCEIFDLSNKTILIYSGDSSLFDKKFIGSYFTRHNIEGFDNLNFENIKSLVNKKIDKSVKKSKDNICRVLNIDGVKDIHTAENDCILEWKIFEKLMKYDIKFDGPDICICEKY